MATIARRTFEMDQSNQYLRPPHPRRPPAHRSVSLLHSPRTSPPSRRSHIQPKDNKNLGSKETSDQSGSSPDDTKPGVYSTGSGESSSADTNSRPVICKDSSGESSNADKWFDKSNNDVSNTTLVDRRANDEAHLSDDPPFFLQHSSSEDKSPMHGQQLGPGQFFRRTNMPDQYLSLGADENSSDDFRGVIDDLTIENNKLKRKLRKYEALQDAHLDDEKLFEIRVHGLPASKKQELEELLRKFADGLQAQPSHTGSSTTTFNKDGLMPSLQTDQTSSSKVSGVPDSAYVSASGPASSAPSGSASGQNIKTFQPSALSRRNNIQNYLHDIPQGLLPQRSTAMTEKTKMKLVVRRLEQIFSGSVAALNGRQHPLQQQEVSQLAAKADRTDREASGRHALAEGNREARIMGDDNDGASAMKTTYSDQARSKKSMSAEATPKEFKSTDSKESLHTPPEQGISEHDFFEKSPSAHSPQQRPTRPLDLDPQRAQIPTDNIDYIRHLGFSPPDAYSSRSPEENHGWIYLNLLINMAQLHTINVTTEFVKKALQHYSTRFELSSDGRKVRWRRNRSCARANSEMDVTSSSSPNPSPSGQSPRKRIKLGAGDKFAYTPMFAKRTSEETDESSAEAASIQSPRDVLENQGDPHRNRSGSRVLKNHRKRENGPIIFYNNAKFCTDLSGDNKTETAMIYNPIMYHVAASNPLGSHEALILEQTAEKKGPLNDAYDLPEPMDLADNPIPASMELNFPPTTPLTSGSERNPIEMEVSGLGGVYPADNFAINVRTKHARNDQLAPQTVRHQLPESYPNRLADIIMKDGGSRKRRSAFHKEFTSSRQKDLPPSQLPPASCFISLDDSDSENDSDGEDSLSFPPGALEVPAASAAPQPMGMVSWSSDEESDDEMSSEHDGNQDDTASDGSLDFLAGAREVAPDFIRAREREYDSIMAERLAEEIPAGSSAATAGGGCGVNTPESVHQVKDADAVMLHIPPLVAASDTDSMIVNEDEAL
ncbi:frequency clock protein [Delphinella strobiligena]|nr:frequency clock protein [Delphinella strobiligena]